MTDPLARLDEMQARADAATDGPWEVQEEEWAVISSGSDSVLHAFAVEKDCIECGTPQDECDTEVVLDIEDAEFIAHARTDTPALIAGVRAILERHAPTRYPSLGDTLYCGCCMDGWREPELFPCPEYHTLVAALGWEP